MRDVGALNLALAVVTVCAFGDPFTPDVVASALGWLAYGIPHVIYHARHLGVFDSAESVAVIASVSSTSVVALVVLWLERSRVAGRGLATAGAGLPAVVGLVPAGPQPAHLALLAHEQATLPATTGRGRTPGAGLP